MAGGASSRMKKSLEDSGLSSTIIQAAKKLHKSLIPLGKMGRPLLYYLIQNAVTAGIRTIYLITSPENEAFMDFITQLGSVEKFCELEVKVAVQHIPSNREKPLGTADALQQCLRQHQNLLDENFTVCNGDNLYDVGAFSALMAARKVTNALIGYDGEGLGHPQEKITKFALLDFNDADFVTDILEKPTGSVLEDYRKRHGKLWVSMNIFNFHGATIYPFLADCPIHPIRKEKELPEAVRNMVKEFPKSMLCIPCSEKIPDLTSASDIATFFD